MSTPFQRIGILGQHPNQTSLETVRVLINFLLQQNKAVILEAQTASWLGGASNLPTLDRDALGGQIDLAITVGGDGSLLAAARALVEHATPILGINRGRLGFLTDILPTEIPLKIGAVLQGNYQQEQRFLLQATHSRAGATLFTGNALNDVVLYAGNVARMIEFEVYIDECFVYSQRSDGLIISTPTGSTAYSLSGGGPILHPRLEAIVLVPMFPHTLTSRPIVVDSHSVIDIIVSSTLKMQPGVSCDGQTPTILNPGDRLQVTRKPQELQLIHPRDYDYYAVLRDKLQWGMKLT